jgi:hypothetical protein
MRALGARIHDWAGAMRQVVGARAKRGHDEERKAPPSPGRASPSPAVMRAPGARIHDWAGAVRQVVGARVKRGHDEERGAPFP